MYFNFKYFDKTIFGFWLQTDNCETTCNINQTTVEEDYK